MRLLISGVTLGKSFHLSAPHLWNGERSHTYWWDCEYDRRKHLGVKCSINVSQYIVVLLLL